MKIGLRGGHSPNCKGAMGYLDEQAEVRKIYYELAPMLQAQGHSVINCNSDEYSQSADLNKGTNTANANGCDIFISIHMNASGGAGNGTECWLYDGNNKNMNSIANRICKNFSENGFKNRGIKYNTGFHDLNATNMPAMIVETLFCDNLYDCNIYNSLGIKKISKLIANGIDSNIKKEAEGYWKEENGKKYYYEDDKKVTGEKKIDGYWYYFDKNGVMITGWCSLSNGRKVYYDSKGHMVFGKQIIDGKTYFFDSSNGAMSTGEENIDGKWYCFDKDGIMITGWYNLPTKRVYYDKDGHMLFGKQMIDRKVYFFDNDNGALSVGEKSAKETSWYCFDKDGVMITGWYDLPDGRKVYYDESGRMVFGEYQIDGKWYSFDTSNGELLAK